MYYYDVTDQNNTLTRIDRSPADRDNGEWDEFCAPTPTNPIPMGTGAPAQCNQYVVKGDRYVHYPMEDLCCYCCSEEHGCGVKSADWIKDGSYVDTDKVRGYDVNEWIPKGDNPDQVVYFETAEKIAGKIRR